MTRKKFSCDFETTTKLDDCRVWAFGWMEIGNIENFGIGNNIDDFMEWTEQIQADLYFQNLRFDGEFIVNWLLHHGFTWDKTGRANTFHTLISNMGQWYQIDICYGYKGKQKIHTRIYDSLKKLPFTVKKIAKDFGLSIAKGEIDYHKEREVGYEPDSDEKEYLINDVQIIAEALDIQFKQGLTKMTNGADSLNNYKSTVSKQVFEKYFPTLSLELDTNIRLAYRGGFTWLNERFAEKEIAEGIVFDVNSLYPSRMYDCDLPYGIPEHYEGQYEYDEHYPLYIQHIQCEFEVKPNHIPTIQIKRHITFSGNEYLKSSKGEPVDLFVTNVDWALIQEHYDVYDVEYKSGWKFRSITGLFKNFIDKWMYIKVTTEGAIKILAKLMLNSLYGKFATNPDITGKVPYLKDDGSCGFSVGENEFRDPVYTPVGVFITSWARDLTIRTAQKCFDRIIYCDTDSIHLSGSEIPDAIADIVDDNRLGYWKHECTYTKGKYLRQKTYMYHVDEKAIIKCAGMPDKVKEKVTFDNFKVGFTSFGKLLPKHVKGGVVLMDTEFTIK